MHLGILPASCRDRLELLRPADTFQQLQPFIRSKITESLFSNECDYDHLFPKKDSKSLLLHSSSSSAALTEPGAVNLSRDRFESSACVCLQLWVRAILGVRRLLLVEGIRKEPPPSPVPHPNSGSTGSRGSMKKARGKQWDREKILRRALFVFFHSHLRATYRHKQQLLAARSRFISLLIEEVIEEALNISIRLARFLYTASNPNLSSDQSAQSADDLLMDNNNASNGGFGITASHSMDGNFIAYFYLI